MHELLPVMMGAVLVHHHLLSPLLRPQGDTALEVESSPAAVLAAAVLLTVSYAITCLLQQYLLQTAGLDALRWPAFVLVLPAVTGLMAVLLPERQRALQPYLPLIAGNCLVLGLALLGLLPMAEPVAATGAVAAVALGYSVLLLLYTRLMRRLDAADIPRAFKGAPLALITAGLMLLALMGLTGPR